MRLKKEDGLTILELLIVVAILAALAGGVVMILDGAEEDSATKIAKSEILEIKKALLKFKQDTGYLPKQGPFELAPPNQCNPSNLNGVIPVPPQGKDWFCSPANFLELYENPLAATTHPLKDWNPDTGRGWRGPYLTRQGEGLVDIGNGVKADGTGNPLNGDPLLPLLLLEVRGVADPFVAKQEACSLTNASDPDPSDPDRCFEWRTSPRPTPPPPDDGKPHDRWGRPYFIFDLDNNNARISGMGPNKTYDNGTGDDIVLYIFK